MLQKHLVLHESYFCFEGEVGGRLSKSLCHKICKQNLAKNRVMIDETLAKLSLQENLCVPTFSPLAAELRPNEVASF